MSKSSKSTRHGDDKNYQRKVMNAPQKVIFEENLKQLHDPRNSTTSGTIKQTNTTVGKKFKSKLRSPGKSKSSHTPPTINQVHPQTTSSKNLKRLSFSSQHNSKYHSTMKVHQDSGEPTAMIHQTKASRKEMKQSKVTKTDDNIVEKEKEIKMENVVEPILITNSNGKSGEIELIQQESQKLLDIEKSSNNEYPTVEISTHDENDKNNKIDEIDSDQNNLNGHKEKVEENKIPEEKSNESMEVLVLIDEPNVFPIENEKVEEEHEENNKEKDDKQSTTVPTIAEQDKDIFKKLLTDECASGSDLVGSTTSESSPIKNVDNQKNKEDDNTQDIQETADEAASAAASFISYDSNIMLKDVQIKLNDCLKDNSKLLDVTDPNASMSESFKDLSFGRTLRGISGRNSLRRMKHVTVRERLLTPNDSLFVNTSGVSLLNDQSRYSELNSTSTPCNNTSRCDRKRKLDDDGNESVKKTKTDESYGLFNSSIEYLRNLRKPIQVSTPKADGFKFNIDETKIKGGDDHTTVVNEPKNWCIIM